MQTRIVVVALAAAALAALASCTSAPEYSRDNASDDQRRTDEALCRAQVDSLMVKDRNIAADRQATLGGIDERHGRSQLPHDMAARDDRNRSRRLMRNCMSARGWTVKKGLF
jgi:hypothetical protein